MGPFSDGSVSGIHSFIVFAIPIATTIPKLSTCNVILWSLLCPTLSSRKHVLVPLQ